jgi:hypothetical protein
MPFPGQNIYELYRMWAEQARRRTSFWVRLRAPAGLGSVQTFSGRQINVGLDGTIEMSADDAQYFIRDGWTKLAEWTTEDDVTLASAFVTRWCASQKVEIVDGMYRVRDDEPTPRIGAGLHKTP